MSIADVVFIFPLYSDIASCCLEGVLDIKGSMKRNTIEAGGTTTHGKWSYGSSQITGRLNVCTRLVEINCMCTVKSVFAHYSVKHPMLWENAFYDIMYE